MTYGSQTSTQQNTVMRSTVIEKTASPVRAISILLAYGALRLQQRQKALASPTEQSVHGVS